jgi:hypothetical protein
MEFKPHGVFAIHREGQVIVVEAAGPWNVELIQNYARDVIPLTRDVAADGPWGAVVLVKHSVLFTLDAAAALREAGFRTAKASGRVAVAYVIPPDVEGALLAPEIIRSIYEGMNPWAIFTETREAMDWVHAQIEAHRRAAS